MGPTEISFHPLEVGNREKYQDKRKTNLQGPVLESDKHGVVFEMGALVFHHPMNNEVH
jgi:hypothetical protein